MTEPTQANVAPKTLDERKAALANTVTGLIAQGCRVESQSDTHAVLVSGKPINHILHLILSLVTCSAWLIVWGALAIFGGEKRKLVNVDEYGNVSVQKTRG